MPDADFFAKPRFCSQCGQPIVVEEAVFCKDCGASLDAGPRWRDNALQPLIAFVLSIIPGLGHIYQGHLGRGIAWFFGVAFAYSAGPIGYLLHLICAASAASYSSARYERSRARRQRRRADRIAERLRS